MSSATAAWVGAERHKLADWFRHAAAALIVRVRATYATAGVHLLHESA